MEARITRALAPSFCLSVAIVCGSVFCPPAADAAGYRTANFTADAPTARLAKEICETAEMYRNKLSQEWLGRELPNWSKPCPIKAQVAPNLGAGGATSFVFDRGEVFGWRMEIQGSRERILDSVIPHEVTHTIFASHFRQPIPRWADEGACTTVEHHSEIAKQERLLIEFLQTRRGIRFSDMFGMKEYPRDVLPLYAQGHSLSRFLIDQRGKREFLAFLEDGLTDENWIRAVRQRYGYRDLLALQNSWQNWVVRGRPPLQLAADADTDGVLLASHERPVAQPPRAAPAPPVVRGQDPGTVAAGSVAEGRAAAQQPRTNSKAPDSWAAVPPGRASVYDARAPGTIRR